MNVLVLILVLALFGFFGTGYTVGWHQNYPQMFYFGGGSGGLLVLILVILLLTGRL